MTLVVRYQRHVVKGLPRKNLSVPAAGRAELWCFRKSESSEGTDDHALNSVHPEAHMYK